MCRSPIPDGDKQFTLDFIAELRKYECLWKIKRLDSKMCDTLKAYELFRGFCKLNREYSEYYKGLWKVEYQYNNTTTTIEAYENMRKFCEKSNKPATIKFVTDTIAMLKDTFAKEILQETNSLVKGKIYKSNLYYYEAMFFTVVLNAPQGFKWIDDEVSNIEEDIQEEPDWSDEDQEGDNEDSSDDSPNESSQDLSDSSSLTSESEQTLVLTAPHMPSSNMQKNCKEIARNEENLPRERETKELDSIANNEDQIINDRDLMDDSIQDFSNAVPSTPASRRSVEVTIPNRISGVQKRKRIASEQTSEVATTSGGSSNKRKSKITYQDEENTNDLVKVACSKLLHRTDEFDSIGNNVAAKLRFVEDCQRIVAERLISDILFHAQMNTLTGKTILCQVPPTEQLPPQLYQTLSFNKL